MLLKAGSDIFAIDAKGLSALDYVINHPQASMRQGVIDFLKYKIEEKLCIM